MTKTELDTFIEDNKEFLSEDSPESREAFRELLVEVVGASLLEEEMSVETLAEKWTEWVKKQEDFS